MIKGFTDWLATQTGLTRDVNLFAGWRDENAPDACTVVLERTPAPVSTEGADVVQKPLQIITRAGSYFAARDQASAIADALINQCGIALTGFDINSIVGNRPGYIGQDVRARHEFSTNIVVRVRTKEA